MQLCVSSKNLICIACWLKTRFEIKERYWQMSSYSVAHATYACWLKTRFEIKEQYWQMSSYSALEGQYKGLHTIYWRGAFLLLQLWCLVQKLQTFPDTWWWFKLCRSAFFDSPHQDQTPSYIHLLLLSETASPELWSVGAHLELGIWQLVIDQGPMSVFVHLMRTWNLNSSFRVARSWYFTSEMSPEAKITATGS